MIHAVQVFSCEKMVSFDFEKGAKTKRADCCSLFPAFLWFNSGCNFGCNPEENSGLQFIVLLFLILILNVQKSFSSASLLSQAY